MVLVLGLAAVLSLFAVIAAKYLTAIGIQNVRQRAAEAESEARRARAQLKMAEQEKAVAGRGISTRDRKRRTLEKAIEKTRKELAELKQ